MTIVTTFCKKKKTMLETLYQYLKLNTEIGSAIISKPPPAPPAVPPTAPAAPPLPLTLTPPAKTKINNLWIGLQKKFKYRQNSTLFSNKKSPCSTLLHQNFVFKIGLLR